MNITLCSGIIALLLSLIVLPVRAQDTITLKRLTDKNFGLTTVVPAGWNDIGNGVYERDQSLTDVTVILQQSMSVSADKVMTSLLPRLGLTTPPERISTYQSKTLKWNLYRVKFQTPTITIVVDLALAEDSASGKTYLVSLQAASEEVDTLYQALFLPVLDAFSPYREPPSRHRSCLHCRKKSLI